MNIQEIVPEVITASVVTNVIDFPVKVQSNRRVIHKELIWDAEARGSYEIFEPDPTLNTTDKEAYVYESTHPGSYYIRVSEHLDRIVGAMRDKEHPTTLHVHFGRHQSLYTFNTTRNEVLYVLDHSILLKDIICIKFHTNYSPSKDNDNGWFSNTASTMWLREDLKPGPHIL